LVQIDKLQSAFHRWEQTASNTGEYVHLTKELLTSCESIEWQVQTNSFLLPLLSSVHLQGFEAEMEICYFFRSQFILMHWGQVMHLICQFTIDVGCDIYFLNDACLR
jgi:hypothetical protein